MTCSGTSHVYTRGLNIHDSQEGLSTLHDMFYTSRDLFEIINDLRALNISRVKMISRRHVVA